MGTMRACTVILQVQVTGIHIPSLCRYQNRYQYLYFTDIVLVWVPSLFCGKGTGTGGMGTVRVPVEVLVCGIVNGTGIHLPGLLITFYFLKWVVKI